MVDSDWIDLETASAFMDLNDFACRRLLVLRAFLKATEGEHAAAYALNQVDEIYESLVLNDPPESSA
jgi:hypothetical protein